MRAGVVRFKTTKSKQLLNFIQKGVVGFVRGVHPRLQPDKHGFLAQFTCGMVLDGITPAAAVLDDAALTVCEGTLNPSKYLHREILNVCVSGCCLSSMHSFA